MTKKKRLTPVPADRHTMFLQASLAQIYLLHYLLPIIHIYRTNNAICPVSACLRWEDFSEPRLLITQAAWTYITR